MIVLTSQTEEVLDEQIDAGIAAPAERPAQMIGMFHDSEFMREVDEECQHMREAARRERSLSWITDTEQTAPTARY